MPVTKKITELAQASVAAGDDVPIAQGGFLKRGKAGQANGFALLDSNARLQNDLSGNRAVFGSLTLQTTDPSYFLKDSGGTLKGRVLYPGSNNAGQRHVSLINDSGDYLGLFTLNATDIRFFTNGAQRLSITSAGHTVPAADNAYTLGASNARWASVWAANGTIQTSDVRYKADIRDSDLGLEFIEALRPVRYRWTVGGNAVEPGEGGAITPIPGRRIHYGLIAQDVKAVLERLNVEDFGGWILADPADPDSDQGLRYDQFIAPLIRAVQQLAARVRELERRA